VSVKAQIYNNKRAEPTAKIQNKMDNQILIIHLLCKLCKFYFENISYLNYFMIMKRVIMIDKMLHSNELN